MTIEEFGQLVTEQGNPGNLRNVVRAVVEVPSPRFKRGIVLVDTPGLGPLARRSAAETLLAQIREPTQGNRKEADR